MAIKRYFILPRSPELRWWEDRQGNNDNRREYGRSLLSTASFTYELSIVIIVLLEWGRILSCSSKTYPHCVYRDPIDRPLIFLSSCLFLLWVIFIPIVLLSEIRGTVTIHPTPLFLKLFHFISFHFFFFLEYLCHGLIDRVFCRS